MHTVAEFYPPFPNSDDMAAAKNFYTSLASLLPCPSCREHYAQMLLDDNIDDHLHSKGTLMRFINYLHNKVNVRIGKPIVAFEEYVARLGMDDREPLVRLEYIVGGVILALIVILCVRLYQNKLTLVKD